MAEKTKIEWCDHTFNPWIGCTKVSPACDNCYAEDMMDRRYGRARWGAGNPRIRTSDSNWRQPRKWNRQAIAAGTRPFVFCSSLADVFDNEVDPAWRVDLFDLIRETPALVWLLLTKRIGNAHKMIVASGGLPSNVAIGATMGNQDEYDRDRMKLVAIKDHGPLFTFGSFEPLLGPIEIDHRAPDWIIVGGESGKFARHMDLTWAFDLLAQAAFYDKVFNFKQVGGRKADKGGHELGGETYFDRPSVPALEAA